LEALELLEKERPDIAFLDIKMPGLTGIEVAERMTSDCRIVFITAYDQYAVEAFEKEAIDYILKPITEERLAKTVGRLQKQMIGPPPSIRTISGTLERVLSTLKDGQASRFLKWVKVLEGEEVKLIPVDDIIYFKAEDKYTLVKSREGESLIRRSIRRLSDELDPVQFWRIHRGTIINVNRIARVNRSFSGRLIVTLKGAPETLNVSRTYAHLFKHM
jgi:DNA-binding LytR/AlgR family response regulator